MEQENITESTNTVSNDVASLSNYITDIFNSFKESRLPWEKIWEECWYNFLGQYQSNLNWKQESEGIGNRSRAFVKLTTLKCHTAHSKITDVLFGSGIDIPFEMKAVDTETLSIPPEQVKDIVRAAQERLKEHFKEIDIHKIYDTGILELAVLGTAVLKGPIIETVKKQKAVPRMIGGVPVGDVAPDVNPYEIQTYDEIVPVIDAMPLWEYYVDLNAKTTKESVGEIHFQRLLPATFRRLAYQGGYFKEAVIEAARRATTNDTDDKRCVQLADNFMGERGVKDTRISVLEYWGLVPAAMLQEVGVELPEGADMDDDIESLVVLAADGIVIKACVNPLGHRPFYVCPYKKRPHVIYGMGVAEAMRDSQKIINSSVRMIIDNKALSGNGMIGINLDRINTKRTRDLKVYSGKVWYTKGNYAPKDAVDSITFADVTGGLRELMEMFERFSDEETGIPKYTSGEQGNFLNKTASGMSMLMTQANINLKTVIKNIDIHWTEPIVESFNSWFQNFGERTPGVPNFPLRTKATGTDSLIAKELKMENLMKFMQITASKEDAIFMDRPKLIKEIANILETRDVMRSDEEIKEIMQTMTAMAKESKDWREIVDIDRLFPMLARSEQTQILTLLGIQPSIDPNEIAVLEAQRMSAKGAGL